LSGQRPLRRKHLIVLLDSCSSGQWVLQLQQLEAQGKLAWLRHLGCSISVQASGSADQEVYGHFVLPLTAQLQSLNLHALVERYRSDASPNELGELRSKLLQAPSFFQSPRLSADMLVVSQVHGLKLFSDSLFFTWFASRHGMASPAGDRSLVGRYQLTEKEAQLFFDQLQLPSKSKSRVKIKGIKLKWSMEFGRQVFVRMCWPAQVNDTERHLHVHLDEELNVVGLKMVRLLPGLNGTFREDVQDYKTNSDRKLSVPDFSSHQEALRTRLLSYAKQNGVDLSSILSFTGEKTTQGYVVRSRTQHLIECYREYYT